MKTKQYKDKLGEMINRGLIKEVSEDTYLKMLEILPPQEWGKTREDFKNISLPVQEYFLVGEPIDHNERGQAIYDCYAIALNKYWYLGEYTSKHIEFN